MPWQDWVFSTGTVIFLFALFPSILSKDKPAFSTSLITGVTLAVFAYTYGSLGLTFSLVTTALVSVGWFTLAFQKFLQSKKES